MIRKYKKIPIGRFKGRSGFCVVSHTIPGKILSCYLSRTGAEKAIERYRRFRNIKGRSKSKYKKQIKKVLRLRS